MQKQPSEGSFKKGFMRIFAEFTKKHLCRNLFFDKVFDNSATSLKSRSRSFQAKIIGITFSQSTTGRLLLIVAISILMKGQLANKTVNYLKGQSKWKNRFQKKSFADFKLGVLKNFLNFTRKHLCWSLFSIKFQA